MSKKILLGITGSIAASKSEKLHSLLSENNETVVFSTDEGLKYISEKFQNKNDIFHSWDQLDGSPHIEYARWADSIVIYPATANFISCLLYTSPSPRDATLSRMPSSA